MSREITNLELYLLLVQGKKITRGAMRQITDTSNSKCNWCNSQIPQEGLCDDCKTKQQLGLYCCICKKGNQNSHLCFQCKKYVHWQCDDSTLSNLNEENYACPDCREILRNTIIQDIIRFLTYFDTEKYLWQMDPNHTRYQEVIKNSIDFVSMYHKNDIKYYQSNPDPYLAFTNDIKLLMSNHLEFNLLDQKLQRWGQIIRVLYDLILKELKPLFGLSNSQLLTTNISIDPDQIMRQISEKFLDFAFALEDKSQTNVKIKGVQSDPVWSIQQLAFSEIIEVDFPKTSSLISWEKNTALKLGYENKRFENHREPLIKYIYTDFIKSQIQQEIKILISGIENMSRHPYLDYLFKLKPPALIDESSKKPNLQELMIGLIRKDLSKLSIVQPQLMNVDTQFILDYVCCSCGGYEYLENLLFCQSCCNTYHFFCQIKNSQNLPLRVQKSLSDAWYCNQCVKCIKCHKSGSKGDLFCSQCNDFYHMKCALSSFVELNEVLDFWRCANCFQCQQCGTKQLFDLNQLQQMRPSTTSNTLHITVEYFQNFKLCLSCGLDKVAQRFCSFCEQYIGMDCDQEIVKDCINQLIPQDKSELIQFFDQEILQTQNRQRYYLEKEYTEQLSSFQCIKCKNFYHVLCHHKNSKKAVKNNTCMYCCDQIENILFKLEKVKQQSIMKNIQAKQIKKVLPYISGFLNFSDRLTPQQQTFVLENLDILDQQTSKFQQCNLNVEQLRFDITQKRDAKDEYIDKLSQYWTFSINPIEQPNLISNAIINRSCNIQFQYNQLEYLDKRLEEEFYEKKLTIQILEQKSINFLLCQQVLHGIQQKLLYMSNLSQIAINSTPYLSELQCLFVANLITTPYFRYVDNQYYDQLPFIIDKMEHDREMNSAWIQDPKQKLSIIPTPISTIRNIKKIIGGQILEYKKLTSKESILVQKIWNRQQTSIFKTNLKKLQDQFSSQDIAEKLKQFQQNRIQMETIVKDIIKLFDNKIQEINLRPHEQETQIEEEPLEPQIVGREILEDVFLPSPLQNQPCKACSKVGNRTVSGRLLYVDGKRWVHVNCALWNEDAKETELCVKALLKQNHKCEYCQNTVASLICLSCKKRSHFYCAYLNGWVFLLSKKLFCKDCGPNDQQTITNFFIWRKIVVQQKPDKGKSSLIRFGNTILINIQYSKDRQGLFDEISLIFIRKQILYVVFDLKNNQLSITVIASNLFKQQLEQNQDIFPQALLLKQNAQKYRIDYFDDVVKIFAEYNIVIHDEDYLGQMFLLYTQNVRSRLLDKNQPKSVSFQMTSFKEWFYTDQFVEDLPLSERIRNIQQIRQVIQNTNNSYSDHPMMFGKKVNQGSFTEQTRLQRKQSELPKVFLNSYDLLKEAEIIKEETQLPNQRDEIEKKLLLDNAKGKRPRLYVAPSNIHKYGLFTKSAIKSGDLVIEYTGEVIRRALADIREKQYIEKGFGDCYMFGASLNQVIDATFKGSEARFLNHSCQPNCASMTVDGKILIYAKQNIASCEELTYDYCFEVESDKIICFCGAKNCLGRLN